MGHIEVDMSNTTWVVAALLWSGCRSDFSPYDDADLTDVEVVRHLEYQVRPTTFHYYLQVAYAESCGDRDPCEVDYNDDRVVDERFSGTATVDERDDRTRITQRDFVYQRRLDCGVLTIAIDRGSFTSWDDGRFEVDTVGRMTLSFCPEGGTLAEAEIGLDYTFAVDYAGTRGVYGGSGTYADSVVGRVETSARGYVPVPLIRFGNEDDCGREPQAGALTLSTGTHEVEVTYDGAASCDGIGAWALDGTAQGDLDVSGSSCTSAPTAPTGLLVLLGLVAALRRRRTEL